MDDDFKRLLTTADEDGVYSQPQQVDFGLTDDLLIDYPDVAHKIVKVDLRRTVFTQLVPTLPPPDTLVYIIAADIGANQRRGGLIPRNTQFDFRILLTHFLELLGNQGCYVYGSTWTLNDRHVQLLLTGLDDGRIARLVLFMDNAFVTRIDPERSGRLVDGFARYPQARFIPFYNHTKILCVANADQTRAITVTSSANWSDRPRHEQFTLDSSLQVYQAFRDQFFETIAARGL